MYHNRIMCRDADVVRYVLENTANTADAENMISVSLKECGNAVVCGGNEHYRTAAALRYALDSSCKRIVYVRYDRDRFVNRKISVDTVLKYSLCCVSLPERCGCVSEIEVLLCKDSVLIVDNYDVGAPSPYMRHLFDMECKVIVLSSDKIHNGGKNAEVIDVSGVAEVNAYPDFSVLDAQSRELLVTLCAILKYLDSSVAVESSKTGVFDRESISFYLGRLSEKLDFLVENGFARILDSGRIYVGADMINCVMSKFSPNAENCKTFMDFADRMCNFEICQESKDVSANLRVVGEYNSFVACEEFLTAYTHFSFSDDKGCVKLYNSLFALVLEKCAMQKGTDYCGYLGMRNKDYFLCALKKSLENEKLLQALYGPCDYLPYEYTCEIRANLDVIRLVTGFVRNLTADMYAENKELFVMLYQTMENVMNILQSGVLEPQTAMLLADDVLRLCEESFAYCEVVDGDGNYNVKRDNPKLHRVFYHCEKQCDILWASSIYPAYSTDTLLLYGMYQKYLDVWLELSQSCRLDCGGQLLKRLYGEKLSERKYRREMISIHFNRIIKGFDKYFDFCAEANKHLKVYEYEFDDDTVKRLEANRRLFLRGFDGGTKTGAERYSDMIVGLCMDDCMRAVLPLFSFDYPVNDAVYGFLRRKDFAEKIRISLSNNRAKQLFLETLVSMYSASSVKKELVKLYEELIEKLWDDTVHTAAFSKRLKHLVCSLYVRIKFHELADNPRHDSMNKNDFATALYEKIMPVEKKECVYCDDLLSVAFYEMNAGKRITVSDSRMFRALEVCIYENVLCDNRKNVDGIIAFAEMVLDNKRIEALKAVAEI